MWLSVFPNMDKKSFISYEKFRGNSTKAISNNNSKKLSKIEIIDKCEEIRKIHQGKHLGIKKLQLIED
jgi:ribosomal protein L44E